MKKDDASPFIRGIENRLDEIFGEDKKKPAPGEVADPPKEATPEHDISGVQREDSAKDSKIGEGKSLDKTQFVRGVENRLDAIFGQYDTEQPDQREITDPPKAVSIDKDIPAVSKDDGRRDFTHDPSEPKGLKESILKTTVSDEGDDKAKRFEELFGELVTSTSIMYSPLKDLKSAVLSIEWEVTDQNMEKYDEEVNKLSDIFAEDKIILGFLKILRFLGRYVRVQGVDAHYVSVKLIMSVYDNLEKVVLSKEMSDAQKHELFCDDARKYREWVETVDLTVKDDATESEEAHVSEELVVVSKKQQELLKGKTVRAAREAASPAGGTEMTPHEAFAFALDEIKKVIVAEFSALRAELKLWRREK